ncbi:MAG: VWA-like domain-containing protein [Ruminococcus sp.]|nr:VWA-like domain-containing protein [Ruminococcus sp.]
MPKELSPEKRRRADELALKILNHSRNMLIMDLRFLEKAVGLLTPMPYDGTICVDGRYYYFDSRYILMRFQQSDKCVVRSYLHMIMHCVFRHFVVSHSIERRLWDLASDIAVEVMLGELGYIDPDNRRASEQSVEIGKLKGKLKYLTAEKILDYFQQNPMTEKRISALEELFAEDDHNVWYITRRRRDRRKSGKNGSDDDGDAETVIVQYEQNDGDTDDDEDGFNTSLENRMRFSDDDYDNDEMEEQWKSVSQRIQTDLETLSQKRGSKAGNLVQNLQAVNREKYDYSEFLRKFAVYGEMMKTDEDSFDYNFYCYGLDQYENVAIIEPLEYSDVKRVREFVIAIDTSGSVQGKTVQAFLQKTYNILKQQESFFSKVNIHIIQCDATVQEDAKITTTDEFDEYLKSLELRGFGGTDFRPVFRYVNKMIENREFEDLRGLIYFTDGCGTYPENQPIYNTAFVFLDDEYNNYDVPVWAMKLILETSDINNR